MGYSVKDKSKPKVLPPSGSHIARCYMVVDLGLQTWEYNREVSEGEKVYIQFELPKRKHVFSPEKGEEPFVIGEEFIVAFGQNSKLRKFIEAWRGRKLDNEVLKTEGFDMQKLVGQPCRLSVEHGIAKSTGNQFAKIGAIMPLDEDDVCPPLINESVYMWMHPEVFNIRDWLNTYKWLQEKAMKSPDWRKLEQLGLTDSDAAYRRPQPDTSAKDEYDRDREAFERSESESRPSVEPDLDDVSDSDVPF